MSSVTLWNGPFADLDAVVRRAFGPGARSAGPVTGFTPAAEVTRDGQDAVVRIEIPGIDPEQDVTVEVVDRRLVVRGERRDERASSEHGRTVREVRYGSFRRTFALPAQVAADAVSASYDAGVLTVRVAGVHAQRAAHRIAISHGTPVVTEADASRPAGPDENAA
jgi:HSP20 family protein